MALLPTVNTEPESASDHPSLSDLHHAALDVLARALQSDDERIALRAAQIVVDRVQRAALAAQPTGEKPDNERVITLRYGGSLYDETHPENAANSDSDNPNDPNSSDDSTAPWANQGYRTPGALQSGRVRTALGQDRNREDRHD